MRTCVTLITAMLDGYAATVASQMSVSNCPAGSWHLPRAFSMRPENESSSKSRSGAVSSGAEPTVQRSAGRVDSDDDDDADDDDEDEEEEESKSSVGAGVGATPRRMVCSSDDHSCSVCGMQRRRGSP